MISRTYHLLDFRKQGKEVTDLLLRKNIYLLEIEETLAHMIELLKDQMCYQVQNVLERTHLLNIDRPSNHHCLNSRKLMMLMSFTVY